MPRRCSSPVVKGLPQPAAEGRELTSWRSQGKLTAKNKKQSPIREAAEKRSVIRPFNGG